MSTILIIDDDASIRSTLAAALADEGYRVATAANGEEGLALVAREQPALVLLDMRMPVLDGWGFTAALARRGIRLPVVVMTAAQDARQWAREVGAVGIIAKPFDLIELLDTVEQHVQP